MDACPPFVIPAQAGIQSLSDEYFWIPAFAGMTNLGMTNLGMTNLGMTNLGSGNSQLENES
jgi:hypothetical protein